MSYCDLLSIPFASGLLPGIGERIGGDGDHGGAGWRLF